MEKDRKELIREYKARKRTAGVFLLQNRENGRFLLGSSLNIEGVWNHLKFALSIGSFRNPALQGDWKKFGESAFEYKILATVEDSDKPGFNLSEELSLLEEIYLEEWQPTVENSYNASAKIRMA